MYDRWIKYNYVISVQWGEDIIMIIYRRDYQFYLTSSSLIVAIRTCSGVLSAANSMQFLLLYYYRHVQTLSSARLYLYKRDIIIIL